MQEAWIQLTCPDCQEHWEANPTDLSEPSEPFSCPYCAHESPLSEFTKTARDLEILRNLQG